jgi:hypothetical protein
MENIHWRLKSRESLRSVSEIPPNIEQTVGRGEEGCGGRLVRICSCLPAQIESKRKPKQKLLAENTQLGFQRMLE